MTRNISQRKALIKRKIILAYLEKVQNLMKELTYIDFENFIS